MRKKWMAAAAVSLCLTFGGNGAAMAAQGEWISTESGWQYQKEDSSLAKGGWEDIEGAWYYFDKSGVMQTGWQKIGNTRFFLQSSGALAQGWQYCDEDSSWYYFDKMGNGRTGWMFDDDSWYWFNANGALNTAASKVIGGERFYFREDGRLIANEYRGFDYYDWEGRVNPDYDITAEDRDGKKRATEPGEREEIGDTINELPKGWLKKFVDAGWKFIYCPDKEYYTSARYDDGGERYFIRYKLDSYQKTLRFTDVDAIQAGFGEYVYQTAKSDLRTMEFAHAVSWSQEEVRDLTGLPAYYDKNHAVVFGKLFEKQLNESGREEIKSDIPKIARILEMVIGSRGYDGTPVGRT